MQPSERGTVEGKLELVIKRRNAEDDFTMGVPGCWVESATWATYTDALGCYSLQESLGPQTINFIYERKDNKDAVLLYTITVRVEPGRNSAEDLTLDPDDPENGLTDDARRTLKQIAQQGHDHNPGLPGFVIGTVRENNNLTNVLAGIRITTNGNWNYTCSDSSGKYCLSRPAQTYTLYAEDPAGIWTWLSTVQPPHTVTIVAGTTKNKNINMSP
jgi:hypothetical protein